PHRARAAVQRAGGPPQRGARQRDLPGRARGTLGGRGARAPAGGDTADMSDAASRRRVFAGLHEAGCFVMPNPWDIGSAKALARLGFRALATTSSGFAWSQGVADNGVPLAATLDHFRAMSEAVEVPVNGDFTGGFAVAPEQVAVNVAA